MKSETAAAVITTMFVAALVIDEALSWLRRRLGRPHTWNSYGWCIHCSAYWPKGKQEPVGCRRERKP